jgi:hypothetical protein
LLEAWLARRRGLPVYHLPVALSDIACGITSQLFNLLTFGLGVAAYAWVYAWRGWDLEGLALDLAARQCSASTSSTTGGTAPATRSTSCGQRTSCTTRARTTTSRSRCARRC